MRAILRQDHEQAAVEAYAFNLRHAGRLLWRYCRNGHYVDTDGVDTHVHHADGRRDPRPPAPFDYIRDLAPADTLP